VISSGDALDALAQHIVREREGLLDAGALVDQVEELVVGDDDQGVDARAQPLDAGLGRPAPPRAFEGERRRHDADGQDARLPREPGDHRRRAGADAAAHAAGHEHQVDVPDQRADGFARLFGRLFAPCWVAARAAALGQPSADLQPVGRVGEGQGLGVGVDGDQLDPRTPCSTILLTTFDPAPPTPTTAILATSSA